MEPRREGERLRLFVAVLGERACPRVVDPLVEGGSAADDLLELTGVPGLRGVADILQGPEARGTIAKLYKENCFFQSLEIDCDKEKKPGLRVVVMRKRSKSKVDRPRWSARVQTGDQECNERCQRLSACHMVGSRRIIEDGTSSESSVE